MAYDSYLCLGGIPIVLQCATIQRVGEGFGPQGLTCHDCDPCCPDIMAGLGYPDGVGPDDLPWYTPSDPDSFDFAGLFVESIEGLGAGAYSRSVTELSGRGAILGRGRQAAPLIVVTGILMGRTCCAVEYGLAWLTNALRGGCDPQALCAGEELEFLSCAPLFPDQDCPENADPDFEALLAPYLRYLKRVALVDGPTVIERLPRACATCDGACPLLRVQFTLAAGSPCVYRAPVTVADAVAFTCPDTPDDCLIDWIPPYPGRVCVDSTACAPADDCATDPDCTLPTPPALPVPNNPCVPSCDVVDVCSACVLIPAGTIPANTTATLVLRITSGSEPLRRVKVQLWPNPLGVGVDELAECDACSTLNISYVAPMTTLVIDGANRTATIECGGLNTVNAQGFIANEGSARFSYPDLACAEMPYTVCVSAPEPIGTGASVSVDVVVVEGCA